MDFQRVYRVLLPACMIFGACNGPPVVKALLQTDRAAKSQLPLLKDYEHTPEKNCHQQGLGL